MKQIRVSVAVLAVASSFLTLIIYWMHWYQHYPWSRYVIFSDASINLQYSKTGVVVVTTEEPMTEETRQLYMAKQEKSKLYQAESILNTPGCTIPKLPVNFTRTTQKHRHPRTCGKRAVFLTRLDEGDNIQVIINSRLMKKYLRRTASFKCCYQYIATGKSNQTRSSACEGIQDGDTIILERDFIKIKCFESGKNTGSLFTFNPIYEDVYAFTKHNNRIEVISGSPKKYNVLLLGMDSMSLSRITQAMPETVAYMKENLWLSFNGYHKIDDNTFPNLMATLTGMSSSTVVNRCNKNIDECKNIFIWDTFKKSGYATAYGEDYLRLPDTFSKDFKFKEPPTDHYMRPLFLQGERETNDKSLVCSGKISSGQHILDYARDFAATYRAFSFFGVFWMNSFSHNANSYPQEADKMFLNFFNQLSYSGVMENTFVIFFSDHGIRFGEHRLKMEAYYDDRLPMLFISVPISFKMRQSLENKYIIDNQSKLVTPYDLHKTLLHINQISLRIWKFDEIGNIDVCPNCQSLFNNISTHRTCKDVKINEKWCACHKMFPFDMQDFDAQRALEFLVQHVSNKSLNIQTRRCWKCMNRTLNKFLRIHYYYDGIDTALFLVLAFTMNPGNIAYEATVEMGTGSNIELVESINAISPYRGLGKCTIKFKDRLFCMCQKVEDCKN